MGFKQEREIFRLDESWWFFIEKLISEKSSVWDGMVILYKTKTQAQAQKLMRW